MKIIKYLLLAFFIIGIYIFFKAVASLYPELLWFKSFDFGSVWWFVLKAKLLVFTGFFLFAFGWLLLNFRIAWRMSSKAFNEEDINISFNIPFIKQFFPSGSIEKPDLPLPQLPKKLYQWLLFLGIVFFSFILAVTAKGWWQDIWLFMNRSSANLLDPIFNNDISFYFFMIPLFKNIHTWLIILLIITIGLVGWIYFSKNILLNIFAKNRKNLGIKKHIFILLSLFIGLLAFGQWLSQYDLLFSARGVVFGAGYTDVYAQLLSYRILLVLFAIEALLVFVWAFRPGLKVPVVFFIVIIVSSIIFGKLYPSILQSYFVAPNELVKEKEFIQHNIKYTKMGYGLDKIQEVAFPVAANLTLNDLEKNKNVINNIRLWNQLPLKQTFSQLQEIRLYYEFLNIDVDRYKINDQLQQVMLSPREMDVSQLPIKAQNWINKHVTYTHGYGVCMSPVNEVTSEGLPYFFIKDLPPVSNIDLDVLQPEIYFGEKKNNSYVITNTKQKEFSYPKGDKNVYSHYEGKGGIMLDGFVRRLIFALRFSDPKILISTLIKSESRILYDRDITTIVNKIAPYLIYDNDPYLVLTREGRLVWILDGYTLSNRFPYSEPFKRTINYIKNAVKVTIDAYSGETNFYIVDNEDPLILTYAKIYSGVYKNFSEMPQDLKEHIRYPKDLFTVQSHMYGIYHMNDPQVFYNKEDVWAIPSEKYEENEQLMDAYYTVTKLPKENKASFILMLPFTPSKKNNMIAWLSAKCDEENYGQLRVYKFPKERTIYGPMQIESRIDQDTDISKLLTLWGQVGSRVIRGNIIVIPIEESLIYVEPIYLQATQSKLPELKRVILAYSDSVVMAKNITEAINNTFTEAIETVAIEKEAVGLPKKASARESLKELIGRITNEFKRFRASAKANDWVNFGKKLKNIDLLLNKLSALQSSPDAKAEKK
ncbi:UPF0182 family protein [Candidatus Margulisiibacteriota bacterium]